MDAKLRSMWTAKATLAGFAPQAPVAVTAIAALPVLPTLSSTATAEARRATESGEREARAGWLDAGDATAAERETPALRLGDAVSVHGADGQGVAPGRISDIAPMPDQPQDAPACRPGDNAALGALPQGGAQSGERSREPGSEASDRPVPQPHCTIEFDPDAEEGEVVASAPALPQAPGAGEGAKQAAAMGQASAAAQGAAEKPQAEAVKASTHAAQLPVTEPPAQPKAPAAAGPAHDAPPPITETAKGVGAAVVDPLMPVETVTFGGDFALFLPPPGPVPLVEPVRAAAEAVELPPALPPLTPLDPDWTLIG